jgi:hypothetical protein
MDALLTNVAHLASFHAHDCEWFNGTLPAQLVLNTAVRRLTLAYTNLAVLPAGNYLTGKPSSCLAPFAPRPTHVYHCAGLEHLVLCDNQFSQLPRHLSLATKLTHLGLGEKFELSPADVDEVLGQLTQLRRIINLKTQPAAADFQPYLASRLPQLQFESCEWAVHMFDP